jgi:anti-sigma-K factor RskA
MNVEEYINSGIIEDYCLGVLNPVEMRAVARIAERYQEVKDAIDESEGVLKKYAEDLDKNKVTDIRSEEILFRLLKKMKNK